MAQRKRRKPISTDKQVAALKAESSKYTVRLRDQRGLYIRVTPLKAKTFVAVARDPYGDQVWATLGGTELSIDEAIEKGREVLKRIKAGDPAFEPPPVKPDSFKAVAENYVKLHVKKNGLRSQAEIERILEKFIYPVWENREFESIRRSDVATLLDMVEGASGPHQADSVLGVVRGIMNWHTSRSDDYVVPIAPRMGRVDPKAKKRDRILDDDEIRAVWPVAEASGTFGAIVRFALLTAQRKDKVASLRWEDVTVDGIWNIPAEHREKGNAGALVLPDAALAVIRGQKRIADNPYVFAGRGGYFKGFSPRKRAFNKKVGNLPRWTIHDLRRTARSLMSRAGVAPHIAERVMGHAIDGVEGVYDRHQYLEEKAEALRRLAGLVETILNPPAGENVVELKLDAQ